MPKAILEYDLSNPQDEEAFKHALKGHLYSFVITDLFNEFRRLTKHSDDTKWCEHADFWRDYLNSRIEYWLDGELV